MKILILSRYQDSVNRGVETFVRELSSRLSKKHQITILSGKDSDSFYKMLGDYDIVMPLNGRTQALKASLGRILKGYKLVIGGHSGIGKDDFFNLLVRPDLFVALTDNQAVWAKKHSLGISITKIPNGIDLEKFKPSGQKFRIDLKRPIILSVGALSWYKYHNKTIQAVSKIENASLLIVGNGELKEKLNKLGNEKLKGRFKIISADYQDLPSIYRASDLFTLPSWDREAFGIVYLEAMATNLPVVAPNDPARQEIVGDGGILTETSDIDKFVEALQNALKKDFRNLPRKQAEKFSWDKVSESYEICFKELTD